MIKSNQELFKGGEIMNCPALRELFASELEEAERKGKIDGKREGRNESLFDLVRKKYLSLEIGAKEAGLSQQEFLKRMEASGFLVPAE